MLALAASEDTTHQHQGLRAGGRADVHAADEKFLTLQTTHPAYLLLANRCTCRHPAAGAIVWSGCKATCPEPDGTLDREAHQHPEPAPALVPDNLLCLPVQILTWVWTQRLSATQSPSTPAPSTRRHPLAAMMTTTGPAPYAWCGHAAAGGTFQLCKRHKAAQTIPTGPASPAWGPMQLPAALSCVAMQGQVGACWHAPACLPAPA